MHTKLSAPCEKVSLGICGHRRQGSDCLRRPQAESLDIIEIIDGEQMPGWDFAHVQEDVNPHILRMLEGTFFAWCGLVEVQAGICDHNLTLNISSSEVKYVL